MRAVIEIVRRCNDTGHSRSRLRFHAPRLPAESRLMPTLSRADNSVLGRWWWTVDRWTLGAVGTLIGFGYIMMLAASPAVAERIGSSRDLFILKQVFFLAAAGAIVVAVSLAVAAQHPPPGDHRLHHRAGAHRGDHGGRRRDQGRAPLDLAAWPVGPAVGVPETLLRRRRRLADHRGPPHAALPRQAAGDRHLPADRAAAEGAAGCRHAGGDHRGVLRPALRRRAEPVPGRHRC